MINEIILLLQRLLPSADFKGARMKEYTDPIVFKSFIQPLIDLQERHSTIIKFCQDLEDIQSPNDEDLRSFHPSLYVNAFKNGVLSVLNDYHDRLKEVELMVLSDENVSIPTIYSRLSSSFYPLDFISAVIEKIRLREIQGHEILDICHYKLRFGPQQYSSAFKRLLVPCERVLMAQIKSWVISGQLFDPFEEFFIRTNSLPSMESSHVTTYSSMNVQLSKEGEYKCDYHLEFDKIPKRIPLFRAKLIFSIGEKIIFFSRNPNGKTSLLHESFSNMSCFNDDQLNIFLKFEETGELNFDQLFSFLELSWLSEDKHLKKLSEDCGNLKGQMKIMKNIYLLGYGELFQEFLIRASHILEAPPSKKTALALKTALENAAYDVYLTDCMELLSRITFVVETDDLSPSKEITAFAALSMKYKAPWPLHLLFSSSVMSSYNSVFKFLLKLKKAEMDLSSGWRDLNSLKSFASSNVKRAMMMCSHFLSLIKNLQNYLYVDVIRGQLEVFRNTIENSLTFSEVQKAHGTFLANVVSQSFLTGEDPNLSDLDLAQTNKVSKCLLKLIELSSKFSSIIAKIDSEEVPDRLKILHWNLGTLMQTLAASSYGMKSSLNNNQIDCFISRFDCNHYFITKYKIKESQSQ